MLLVNDNREILLLQNRSGKWGLPGGVAERTSRLVAAERKAEDQTGIRFSMGRLFYHNRHRVKVWIGYAHGSPIAPRGGRWFPINALPDDDSLAFGLDVRTIEKWAAENSGSRRIAIHMESKPPLSKYFTNS